MVVYELKNIAKLNAEGVDYRCLLWNISKIMQLTGLIILN